FPFSSPPSSPPFPYTTLFRSHRPPVPDPQLLQDGEHRGDRAPGGQDHLGPGVAQRGHGLAHRRRHPLLVVDERAVDVEGDHELGSRRGERRGEVGADDVGGEGHARSTGVRTSSPPREGCGPAGTRTEPSGSWWFSRIATSHRVVARVPLRVATGSVPAGPRWRIPSRRAWKV